MTSRLVAAAKYRPEKIRVLFIAEAPPNEDRYFFFEDVATSDWLWIALMKALFPNEWQKTSEERNRKAWWLRRFQKCGCWLIDAVKQPISGSDTARIAAIRSASSALVAEIREIAPEQVVLIKPTVHEALSSPLADIGFVVVNEKALPFPASSHQNDFHTEMRRLIDSGRLSIR
jgi:hypothetical protein